MHLLFYYEFNNKPVRGIKEAAISFSDRDYVTLTDHVIKWKPLKYPLPARFYDENNLIYNVTFFVGDNGAGKTSLIHHMIDFIYASKANTISDDIRKSESRILLFEENNTFYFSIFSGKDSPSLQFYKVPGQDTVTTKEILLTKDNLQQYMCDIEEIHILMSYITCIYLSNVYSLNDINLPKIFNHSLAKELQKHNTWIEIFKQEMLYVFNQTKENLIAKVSQFQLPIPQYLYISVKDSQTDHEMDEDNYYLFLKLLEREWKALDESLKLQKNLSPEVQTAMTEGLKILKFWKENENLRKYLVHSPVENTFEYAFQIPTSEIRTAQNQGDNINIFFNAYGLIISTLKSETSKEQNPIIFSWGMSSGEEYLLRVMTNLYLDTTNFHFHKEEIGKACILCFWDEIDCGFHPDWQRRLLGIWTEFMIKIFKPNAASIQLFATSHSPLLLGDIPGSCVVHMQKSKNGQVHIFESPAQTTTFGENIYTILRNDFSMVDGSFGAISQKKAKDILDCLDLIRLITGKSEALSLNNTRVQEEWKVLRYYESQSRKDRGINVPEVLEEDELKNNMLNILSQINDWYCLDHLETLANLFSGIFRKKLLQELESTRAKLKPLNEQISDIDRQIHDLNEKKLKLQRQGGIQE